MIPIPIDRRTTTTPLPTPTPTPTPSPTNTSPISRPRLSPSPSQPSLWRALFGSHTHARARPPSVRARQLTISRPPARGQLFPREGRGIFFLSFFRSKVGDRQKSACVGSDMGRRFHLGLVVNPRIYGPMLMGSQLLFFRWGQNEK